MAEKGKETPVPGKPDIKTDELVDRLSSERGNSGPLIKLVGRFLGNSEREGYYRLYLSEDLNRYLEFMKEGTLDAERFATGRIVVWLRPGTKVVETFEREIPEDFLKGSVQLQSDLLRQGSGVLGGTGRMMMMMANSGGGCCGGTQTVNCNSTIDQYTCSNTNCPTSQIVC